METYNIAFNTVNGRIALGNAGIELLASTFILVVDNLADLEHTGLLECPGRQPGREVSVSSCHSLVAELRLLGKPLVLEQLSRSKNGQTCRVVSLHSGDKAQLLTHSEWVLHRLGLILGVVAVRCARCTENGGEHRRIVSEDLPNSAGNSNVPLSTEVVLDARSQRSGVWEQQNIVFL